MGTGPFKGRKPKVPGELTLRAEEVDTLKSHVNVDHIEKERWSHPLADHDWYAFCQALYEGIEGVEYGFCYTVNRSFTMCHPLTL